MPTNDLKAAEHLLVLIPGPIWQEWKINGVGADSSKELQAEHASTERYKRSCRGRDGQALAEAITRARPARHWELAYSSLIELCEDSGQRFLEHPALHTRASCYARDAHVCKVAHDIPQ